jgi:hypothetical protein
VKPVATLPTILQPRVVVYDAVCHLCHRGTLTHLLIIGWLFLSVCVFCAFPLTPIPAPISISFLITVYCVLDCIVCLLNGCLF